MLKKFLENKNQNHSNENRSENGGLFVVLPLSSLRFTQKAQSLIINFVPLWLSLLFQTPHNCTQQSIKIKLGIFFKSYILIDSKIGIAQGLTSL